MFLYPLRPSPLILILIVANCIWLIKLEIILGLTQAGILGTFAPILARYLFAILQHTANGYFDPPALDGKALAPFSESRHFKLIVVLVLVYSLLLWLSVKGFDAFAYFLAFGVLILLPAFIGLLTLSNRLLIAINPVAQFQFIAKAGLIYWFMLLAMATFVALIKALDRWEYGLFLSVFVTLYSVVLLFYWLGRMIYAKRQVFDHHPDKSPERKAEQKAFELAEKRGKCLQRVFEQRRLNNALNLILPHIEREEDQLSAHRWFHESMMEWDNKKAVIEHGRHYVKVLRSAGKTAAADYVIAQLKQVDPSFSID